MGWLKCSNVPCGHQPKLGNQVQSRMICRGGEVVVFPQDISEMNRTRATQASQPHILVHSRLYGWAWS